MPYSSNEKLPKQVRTNLPAHAQTIFRKTYNSAHEEYKDPHKRRGDATLQETSNKVAWSAVKKVYRKEGDQWTKK